MGFRDTDTDETVGFSKKRKAWHEQLLGRMLVERYLLEEQIGRGGFGVVFRARDTRLAKRVAIKVLSPSVAIDEEALLRFKQEASAAARIGHKFIVDVTDFDEDEDGTFFLVMELIDGTSLRDAMKASERMPLSRALVIASRVGQALAAAHAAGIVHRDLKPGNILLTNVGPVTDFVKVLDFGISKVLFRGENEKTLTSAGQMVGTPRYMSPEQGIGKAEIDGRSDVYSLATILFEMIVGETPYTSEIVYELIHLKVTEDPGRPSQLVPGLEFAQEVDALVARGLARDVDDRFQSMAEFDQAIRALLERVDPVAAAACQPLIDSPPKVPAPHTSTPRAITTWEVARKSRARLWLGVSGLLAVVLGYWAWPNSARSVAQPTHDSSEAGPVERSATMPDAGGLTMPAVAEMRLKISPPGAMVELDGVRTTAEVLTLTVGDEQHVLLVSAPGHKPVRREFKVAADGELFIELEKDEADKVEERTKPAAVRAKGKKAAIGAPGELPDSPL